jgi:hypothetical protein
MPEDLLPFIQAMATKGIQLVSFLSLMGAENNPVPPYHNRTGSAELRPGRCNTHRGFGTQNHVCETILFEMPQHIYKKRGLDKNYVSITVMLYFMTRMGTAKMVTQEFEKLTSRKAKTFKQFAESNKSAWQ